MAIEEKDRWKGWLLLTFLFYGFGLLTLNMFAFAVGHICLIVTIVTGISAYKKKKK